MKKNKPQESMTKIHLLRRFLLPCISPATATAAAAAPSPSGKKRISTSLRDDDETRLQLRFSEQESDQRDDSSDSDNGDVSEGVPAPAPAPARPSKTMVTGTIFGARRGHVWFCVQHDRVSPKPTFLIELSIPTQQLVKEMRSSELVRLALECSTAGANPELISCPLRSIPVWTLSCNGRKLGFALKRKVTEQNRVMLKTMQSITVGAGVIPAGSELGHPSEEIMYMRANYEHMVGSSDSESFHLINPDGCPGQELSVFLLRSQ